MKKILICLLCLICLVGCSEDSNNDYEYEEEDYSYEEDYDYNIPVEPSYEQPSERPLNINDLRVEVNTMSIPNYTISVTSDGSTYGSILFNLNCNYNYQIGTIPTVYSGYATASSYVYFSGQRYSSAVGYMPMQFNPFNISCSYTYNIMSGTTIVN